MEISFDIFLFLTEKELILTHIFSIEYKGLVLWLWPLELNDYAYSTKNCPFCAFTYCEKGNNIFIIVVLLFIFFRLFRTVQN